MPTITTRHFLKTSGVLLAGLVLAAPAAKQEPAAPAAGAPAAPPVAAAAKVYGTDAAYAPFESQNDKLGEIVGLTSTW
jgi:polar amino acid transport system substrate-binding protein